jgi:hypothetical protein
MALWDQMTNTVGQDFSGTATNPGYAGLSNVELGDLGVPGYEPYSGAPGAQPSLWDKLMEVAGDLGTKPGAAPGPTSMPGGAKKMGDLPPQIPLPQGQMRAPPGLGAYFQALQNPPGSGLNAQYMALQRLMQGG